MNTTVLIKQKFMLHFYTSINPKTKTIKRMDEIFPIIASPKLAGIVADLMADGHLQKNRWRFDYTSKDKKELLRFEKALFKIFKTKGKIRPCTTNKHSTTYNYGVNEYLTSKILSLIGVPRGEKVTQGYNVPSWILKDKDCFRKFIQRLFTCDGWVSHSPKYHTTSLAYNQYKLEPLAKEKLTFIKQISEYLKKYFNISTNISLSNYTKRGIYRKDKKITTRITLRIKNKDIIKFHHKVGFDEGLKRKRLKKIIEKRIKKQTKSLKKSKDQKTYKGT